MKRRAAIALMGSMLALSLWSMSAYSQNDEKKEAQEAVLKLMEALDGKKGDVKSQTQAIRKKFDDLDAIMHVYKARNKGGIGWGKDGSDLEKKIGHLGDDKSKDKLTPAKVAAVKDDLVKVADLSRAVAEISKLYPEQYKENDTGKKNPAKWKQYTEKMSKGAEELREAAKGGDFATIKRAINNLDASCNKCHKDFR